MPGGVGPVFSIWAKDPDHARRLPSRMFVFQHATSLGGVESLIQWRAMSDVGCDKRLLRISCGIEEFEGCNLGNTTDEYNFQTQRAFQLLP